MLVMICVASCDLGRSYRVLRTVIQPNDAFQVLIKDISIFEFLWTYIVNSISIVFPDKDVIKLIL